MKWMLVTEAAVSPKTSIHFNQTIRCHIPDNSYPQIEIIAYENCSSSKIRVYIYIYIYIYILYQIAILVLCKRK